jgi:hypothetical protein
MVCQLFHRESLALFSATLLLGACTISPTQMAELEKSPAVISKLQVVSSGHTGCMPEDNQISVIWAKPDGSGLWKAGCKGKTYLCSTITSAGGSATYSCALEAQ